jgi:hypothetical protein
MVVPVRPSGSFLSRLLCGELKLPQKIGKKKAAPEGRF